PRRIGVNPDGERCGFTAHGSSIVVLERIGPGEPHAERLAIAGQREREHLGPSARCEGCRREGSATRALARTGVEGERLEGTPTRRGRGGARDGRFDACAAPFGRDHAAVLHFRGELRERGEEGGAALAERFGGEVAEQGDLLVAL